MTKKEKSRLEELFLLAEEVNHYGSLESRLPSGVVEKVRVKKTRTKVTRNKVQSERTISEEMLQYTYGL